jgi:hypothetical protein
MARFPPVSHFARREKTLTEFSWFFLPGMKWKKYTQMTGGGPSVQTSYRSLNLSIIQMTTVQTRSHLKHASLSWCWERCVEGGAARSIGIWSSDRASQSFSPTDHQRLSVPRDDVDIWPVKLTVEPQGYMGCCSHTSPTEKITASWCWFFFLLPCLCG